MMARQLISVDYSISLFNFNQNENNEFNEYSWISFQCLDPTATKLCVSVFDFIFKEQGKI